jgi:2'-5' RNA ligase
MRLFIAVDLENEDYFRGIQKQLDKELSDLTLTKTYHLTLKFLGEVDDSLVPKIKEALEKVSFEHFSVKTTKIGVFPNANFVRVIWIGLEPEDKIIKLKNKMDDALKELFKSEKDFTAHVTLARIKFIKDKIKFSEDLKKLRFESKEFHVKNIKLIKSTLMPDGPTYETLSEF